MTNPGLSCPLSPSEWAARGHHIRAVVMSSPQSRPRLPQSRSSYRLVRRELDRLDRDDQCARIDKGALLNTQLGDGASKRRLKAVLHLHRLEHGD